QLGGDLLQAREQRTAGAASDRLGDDVAEADLAGHVDLCDADDAVVVAKRDDGPVAGVLQPRPHDLGLLVAAPALEQLLVVAVVGAADFADRADQDLADDLGVLRRGRAGPDRARRAQRRAPRITDRR